jgi:hypothetical protein
MQTACPLYKIPSRNTFRRRVDDIYDVISCKFKESLSKVQHVAVTTDAWTEMMQVKSFLGITLHLIHDTKLESSSYNTLLKLLYFMNCCCKEIRILLNYLYKQVR